MDLRTMQAPLKERYSEEPDAARITLTARASQTDAPVGCSVEAGEAIREAQAHGGVGGPGTGACSGDLLLGALAVCAQAPGATEEQLASLREKTERYCTVMQTLRQPPELHTDLSS